MARGNSKRLNNDIPAGTRFGKLIVVELVDEVRKSGYRIRYRCKCDCGGEKLVSGSNLKKGSVKSCGCKRWQSTSIVDKIPKMVRVMENGCWIWGKGKRGEHKMAWDKGKRVYVHRALYEAYKGPIPIDMYVCHNCPGGDNPSCCNPDHLWLGTHAENLADMARKGGSARGARSGHAKLTETEVVELFSRYHTIDISLRALAKEYGVAVGTVASITQRRNWKHVTDKLVGLTRKPLYA